MFFEVINYLAVKRGIDFITLLYIIFLKLNKILPYLIIENCADRGAPSLFNQIFVLTWLKIQVLNCLQ